jgi:hypothetical protein
VKPVGPGGLVGRVGQNPTKRLRIHMITLLRRESVKRMCASGERGQRCGACWARLGRWASWAAKERWEGGPTRVGEG